MSTDFRHRRAAQSVWRDQDRARVHRLLGASVPASPRWKGIPPISPTKGRVAVAALSGLLASSAAARGVCTLDTIAGSYVATVSGSTGLSGPPNAVPFRPITGVRVSTFDGRGGYRGEGFISQGGHVSRYTAAGTYRVTAGCAVSIAAATVPGGTIAHQEGFIAGNGQTVHAMLVDEGENILINYERK